MFYAIDLKCRGGYHPPAYSMLIFGRFVNRPYEIDKAKRGLK